MSKPTLKLDWCSHAAAKYAVEHWHYSASAPWGKTVKIGVWEDACFIGALMFTQGANNHIGSPYGLAQVAVCELARIALTAHRTPLSRIGRIALILLRHHCPELRLIVSYADPMHGHHGGIYQAMGWLYAGCSTPQRETLTAVGHIEHKRTVFSRHGTVVGAEYSAVLWKHKYLYPLDAAMRTQITPLAQPYPKRATSILADAPAVQAGESGASPTVALTGQ